MSKRDEFQSGSDNIRNPAQDDSDNSSSPISDDKNKDKGLGRIMSHPIFQKDKDIRSRAVGGLLAVIGGSSLVIDALNDIDLEE